MCTVCAANLALTATHCGDENCETYRTGAEFNWGGVDAHDHAVPGERGHRVAIFVRARGCEAEKGYGEYQIRQRNKPWLSGWTKAGAVLADEFGALGLDGPWRYLPGPLQDFALGKRDVAPTVEQCREWWTSPEGQAARRKNRDWLSKMSKRKGAKRVVPKKKPGKHAKTVKGLR